MKNTILLVLLLLSACNNGKKYHSVQNLVKKEKQKDIKETIIAFQEEMNNKFKDPNKSPLTQKDFVAFKNLDFFSIDTTYTVTAFFERTPNELPFLMPTSTDRMVQEVLYAKAHFMLQGKKFQLNIYQSQQLKNTDEYRDYLFLPFSDATNSESTYGGGRYIDLRIPKGDSIVIDFNKAYNPYCAYNEKFSCPIVPKENTLPIRVKAGTKKFDSSVITQ